MYKGSCPIPCIPLLYELGLPLAAECQTNQQADHGGPGMACGSSGHANSEGKGGEEGKGSGSYGS